LFVNFKEKAINTKLKIFVFCNSFFAIVFALIDD